MGWQQVAVECSSNSRLSAIISAEGNSICFIVFLLAAAHTYKQVAQNNPDVPGAMPAPVRAEIQSDPKELVEQGHSDDP